MSELDELRLKFEELRTRATTELAAAADANSEHELRRVRATYLGENLKPVKALAPKLKKDFGLELNAYIKGVEDTFRYHLDRLAARAREAELTARPLDLTLPGRLELGRGHAHPIRKVMDDLLAIFASLGFVVVPGREVELEENNFGKLAFPPDHPATDMQDSFWIGPEVLLRTHTSNVQVREMSRTKPPLAVVSAGPVYRRDDDLTHSPMFHQLECFLVDRDVTLANLEGVLDAFAARLFGPGTTARIRPSYFPFVEPGAEVDVACAFCVARDGSRAGCRVCKHTGWLEIGGAGMIHPEVFRSSGIDSDAWTGFAFGMGIERMALLRYGIPSIKLLFENDPRVLEQF